MMGLLNRLKERSTWLAIFTVAGLVGIKIEPEFREAIINAILAVAAVVAFVFRENVRERSTDLDQSARQETPLPPVPPLPPIELVGKSDASVASQPTASDGANHPVSHARRVTDAWLHDPVPSVPGFKVPPATHGGQVGWNDDH